MVKIICSRENGKVRTEILINGEQKNVGGELEAIKVLLEGMGV